MKKNELRSVHYLVLIIAAPALHAAEAQRVLPAERPVAEAAAVFAWTSPWPYGISAEYRDAISGKTLRELVEERGVPFNILWNHGNQFIPLTDYNDLYKQNVKRALELAVRALYNVDAVSVYHLSEGGKALNYGPYLLRELKFRVPS
jgi:hypothetical protein